MLRRALAVLISDDSVVYFRPAHTQMALSAAG
jgi:hypothetical protein